MSIEAFRWAKAEIAQLNNPRSIDHRPLSSPQCFVLIVIADYYNDNAPWYRAWPSQKRIALVTGLSVRTVIRAVEVLRERGLVVTESWVRDDGSERMQYRYLLPKYRPEVMVASAQPVRAYSAYYESSADFESMLKVPGSGLYVDEGSLD